MILAADIGGTKSLIALFQLTDNILNAVFLRRFASKDFSSLEAMIHTFIADYSTLQGSVHIEVACFGLAGPISNESCYLVNLGWSVETKNLQHSFPEIPNIYLCNDLEATGYGLPLLSSSDLLCLTPEKETSLTSRLTETERRRAILAPGTGLGEVFLLESSVFASEGAHCEFGPRSELEIRIWRHFNEVYGHVSYERILSGQGLCQLEQFFRKEWNAKEAGHFLQPEDISRLALSGQCPVCHQALDHFVDILGAEAGNLALTFLALDGIYLAGGIPSKIIPKLEEQSFLRSFYSKGRFSALLKEIPIFVILNANIALFGAASFAVKRMYPTVELASISAHL